MAKKNDPTELIIFAITSIFALAAALYYEPKQTLGILYWVAVIVLGMGAALAAMAIIAAVVS